MDLVLTAIRSDLTSVLNTGTYLLTGLFLLAVFTSYVGIISNRANWADVILRLVIGLIILQNYVWIMDKTYEIVVSVDQAVNPEQNFVNQYASMSDNMQQQFKSNTQQSFATQISNTLFGQFSLHNIIINLSFIFYAVIAKAMEAIRYSLAEILYKLGPILVPFILFHSTSRILKGWYIHYVSVLCWPILWHIVLSIAVALSQQIGTTGQGIEQFACLNFAVCFVLIFSPFIVASLANGAGLGNSSGLLGIVSSNSFLNAANMFGLGGVRTASSIMTGNVFQNTGTPTTMGGKFKDPMLGKDQKED